MEPELEVVHLESALTHPDYVGLSKRELAARVRAELSTEAPMGVLAAVTWLLASARVVRTAHRDPAPLDRPRPLFDVVLDVVEKVGHHAPGAAEEVENAYRDQTLPLVCVVKTRRD